MNLIIKSFNYVLITITVSGCRAPSFDPFLICVIPFTDKQMDNKEVNDPLTSVTLIKGKSPLTVFCSVQKDCWYVSAFHDAPDTAYLSDKRRKKKIMSHTWERL